MSGTTLDETDPENNLYRGRLGSKMDELGGMSMYGPVVVAPFVGIGPKDVPNGQGQKSSFIITKEAPSRSFPEVEKERDGCPQGRYPVLGTSLSFVL